MRLRTTLLLFASAVLLGTHAQAATLATSAGLPFCVADLAAPAVPDWTPNPSPRSIRIPCGVCSSSACQGLHFSQICGIGGGGVYLLCADNGDCSQDGRMNCLCKSGPPG